MDLHIHKALGGYIIDHGKGNFQVATSFQQLTAILRDLLETYQPPAYMGSVMSDILFVQESTDSPQG
jgi:hypothetical protein